MGPRTAAAIRMYVGILSFMAVPFFVVGTLLSLSRGTSFPAFLWIGAPPAAIMSVALGTVSLVVTRGKGPEALRVRSSRVIEVAGPRSDVLRRTADAIASLSFPPLKVIVDPESGSVRATKGVSWRSWGEHVRATVESVDDRRQRVTLASRPSFPLTIADCGANFENVAAIADTLTAPAEDTHTPA